MEEPVLRQSKINADQMTDMIQRSIIFTAGFDKLPPWAQKCSEDHDKAGESSMELY